MEKGNIFDYKRVRSPDMTEVFKNVDDAFALGKPYTLTTSTTLTTDDLGKSIRVNATHATDALTITFPAVGSDEDGGNLSLIKQKGASLTNKAGSGDMIGSYATSYDKTSSLYAASKYEYVHGLTRWVKISHEGTWASA